MFPTETGDDGRLQSEAGQPGEEEPTSSLAQAMQTTQVRGGRGGTPLTVLPSAQKSMLEPNKIKELFRGVVSGNKMKCPF